MWVQFKSDGEITTSGLTAKLSTVYAGMNNVQNYISVIYNHTVYQHRVLVYKIEKESISSNKKSHHEDMIEKQKKDTILVTYSKVLILAIDENDRSNCFKL